MTGFCCTCYQKASRKEVSYCRQLHSSWDFLSRQSCSASWYQYEPHEKPPAPLHPSSQLSLFLLEGKRQVRMLEGIINCYSLERQMCWPHWGRDPYVKTVLTETRFVSTRKQRFPILFPDTIRCWLRFFIRSRMLLTGFKEGMLTLACQKQMSKVTKKSLKLLQTGFLYFS